MQHDAIKCVRTSALRGRSLSPARAAAAASASAPPMDVSVSAAARGAMLSMMLARASASIPASLLAALSQPISAIAVQGAFCTREIGDDADSGACTHKKHVLIYACRCACAHPCMACTHIPVSRSAALVGSIAASTAMALEASRASMAEAAGGGSMACAADEGYRAEHGK